jgi:hypothetical protein
LGLSVVLLPLSTCVYAVAERERGRERERWLTRVRKVRELRAARRWSPPSESLSREKGETESLSVFFSFPFFFIFSSNKKNNWAEPGQVPRLAGLKIRPCVYVWE